MLVIRLNRFGKKNQAAFRLVLQEKTKAPGRRHVEMLGSHNPHTKVTLFNKERIMYWISQGAQPSERVHNMLVKAGVIEGKIIPKKMPRPVKKEEEVLPVAETPVTEEKQEVASTETPATEEVKAPEVAEAPKEEAQAPVKEEVKA